MHSWCPLTDPWVQNDRLGVGEFIVDNMLRKKKSLTLSRAYMERNMMCAMSYNYYFTNTIRKWGIKECMAGQRGEVANN